MSQCDHCGAPLERDFERQATCAFCDRVNAPLQREVEVAVPVQVVQKVVQVVGAAANGPEAVELRCPHCRKRLVSVLAKASRSGRNRSMSRKARLPPLVSVQKARP